jgi:hypothetical protein
MLPSYPPQTMDVHGSLKQLIPFRLIHVQENWVFLGLEDLSQAQPPQVK